MHDGSSTVLAIDNPDSPNNDAGVTSVTISPDGRWVAAGSLDTVVRIWEVATGKLVERLRGHRKSVYSVTFTPDGRGLVSGSLDKTLKYWDVSGLNEGGSSQCTMNFTSHKVRSFSFLLCFPSKANPFAGLCPLRRRLP
jgi:glucose repression regulatory protein TUP1